VIKNYFKIAWRNLWRHKRMTFINVAGLGVGMAATVLIAMWVQNELSFDKAQPDSENIYRVKTALSVSANETWLWESAQYILGQHALSEIPEVKQVARLSGNNDQRNFYYKGKLIAEKNSVYVDDQWLSMFHYDFVSGSADAFNKNPFSLILTQSAAERYFGKEEAVGKVLRLDTIDYQVQAVVKDNPVNSSFQFDVLIPLAARLTDAAEKARVLGWGNFNYLTFLKLKPGSDSKRVAAKLTEILKENRKDNHTKTTYSLLHLKDMHFENDLLNTILIHGNSAMVNVFIVLAVLMLLTACINYVNLTTARSSIRSKEVSVRKVVGANRWHLFGQFMSESILVSVIALILSVVLVQAALPWFRTFTDKQFDDPLTSPVAWTIIGCTLFISFLLNGIYPAAMLSSFHPLNVFRGKTMLNFKDAGLRKMLVVVQFTISVVLIISTLVIYTQLNFIQTMDPGYSRAQVFMFTLPWKAMGPYEHRDVLFQTIDNELKQKGAIADVAMTGDEIINITGKVSGGYSWTGKPKDFNPTVVPISVDVNFGKMMQLKVKEGRWFNNDVSDRHNVLLNETAVAMFKLKGPVIGQRFIAQDDTGVVIGILKNFNYQSAHDKIGPVVVTQNARDMGSFYIKTRPKNTAAAIAAAQQVWEKFAPGEPFEFKFLDEAYNKLYRTDQQSSVLITAFAGIAILVSALGLLGLAAFAAEQKVKEIGIRKVLGAGIQHIVALLSVDFLKMVVIASLIAFPIAWWAMSKWLQEFAYRIDLSWWQFAASAGIAFTIALITVSFQSVKAAVANPVKSLRAE